jgi:hypothetical protein
MIESLVIHLSGVEFSRYEADRSILRARVIPAPAVDAGEKVTVKLVRKDGVTVASKEIDFTAGAFPKGAVVTFDLAEVSDGFPIFTTGDYVVRAESAEASAEAPFIVSTITVATMKKTFCAGLSLKQVDVLAPVKQPQLVTGVRIIQVSDGVSPGIYVLGYDETTLQWNGGAKVDLPDVPGTEVLPDDRGNWLMVEVDPFELPEEASAEGIIIDYASLDDSAIRSEIASATAEIERSIGSFIEPKRVATEPFFSNPGEGEFFDVKAQAAHFYRRDAFSAASLAWRIGLPYVNFQKLDFLEGYFGGSKVLTLNGGMFAMNRPTGTVEVLPQAQELAYIITFFTQLNYWGVRETITDFWRYKGVVGVPESTGKADLLKAVGYTAAIPILAIAGQAARGGRISDSMSKDGVSRSSSYNGEGLYAATIKQCEAWLTANKGQLRKRYGGAFTMTTL